MALKQQLFILKRQRAFWFSLVLFLLVLLANMTAAFQSINAFTYQFLAQLTHSQNSSIVIIESENLVTEHQQVVTHLDTLEADAIVVIAKQQLVKPDNLSNPQVYYPHSRAATCLNATSQWGSKNIVLVEPTQLPSCNNVWAQLFSNFSTEHEQLINFSLGVSALPKFSAERLLNNDVMAEQIKGKIVLVGQAPDRVGVSLNAPKLTNSNNYLLLAAYIADTLDKNTAITPIPLWQQQVLSLLLVIALLFVYQKLPTAYNIILASALSLLWLLTSYLAISHLNVFIPAGQLCILSFVTLLWILVARNLAGESDLKQLVINVQQKMLGRYLPRTFTEQQSPWDPIIQLVSQQLALEKSIFLSRKEGDHRLIEIRAINCQLNDIQEMRRDYKRSPYSSALKAMGMIEIERPFFKTIATNEVEFIVPLIYAGDVRGFWALTVLPDEHFNRAAFEKNVNAFAAQIGELLFHYRVFQTSSDSANNALSQLLTMSIAEPINQKVRSSFAAMEQKLATLEHVFNHVRSASVLFNLFGQVVQINKSLEQLANKHQLPIFDMSALDLLCATTALSDEEAKGKLRYLTLQKGDSYFQAKLTNEDYILNVRAISSSDVHSAAGEPFQISGILFEFINLNYFLAKLPEPEVWLQETLEQYQSDSATEENKP